MQGSRMQYVIILLAWLLLDNRLLQMSGRVRLVGVGYHGDTVTDMLKYIYCDILSPGTSALQEESNKAIIFNNNNNSQEISTICFIIS